MIRFTVHGVPAPAGSKRGFNVGGRVVVTDDSKRSRPWKAQVADAAAQAMNGRPLLEGPLALTAAFVFPRPKAHTGVRGLTAVGRRNPYPAVKPDATKLLRAVEDACNGVLWKDDAQVVWQLAAKLYGGAAYAYVQVEPAGTPLERLAAGVREATRTGAAA